MHFTALTASALASLSLFPAVLASPVAASEPAAEPATLARRNELVARVEPLHDTYLKDDDEHQIGGTLEHVFDVLTTIPDQVLQDGDDATDKWLKEHGHRPATTKRAVAATTGEVAADLEDRGFWDVAKCAGAIAAFIASNAIGAAKLLRIKKYIEALGGVRKAAELLLKASNNAERLKEGGEALALLAGEILGVSMVSNNC